MYGSMVKFSFNYSIQNLKKNDVEKNWTFNLLFTLNN